MSLTDIDQLYDEAKEAGVWADIESYYLEREDSMADSYRRFANWVKWMKKKGIFEDDTSLAKKLMNNAKFNCGGGISLHYLAFMPTLKMLGTDEQVKKWYTLAKQLKIIGCYA